MSKSSPTVQIAEGTHQQIMGGQLKQMISEWDAITTMNDDALVARHGRDASRPLADVLSTLVYAQIAKAAFSLVTVADIKEAAFSPKDFGERCAETAREQRDRYRATCEQREAV
jgi:hypothetical protein